MATVASEPASQAPALDECVKDMSTFEKRETVSKSFFPNTGHNYDRCVAGATVGFDAEWKRLMLREVPKESNNILELASGTAIVSKLMLEKCGVFDTKLTCVDITDDYVDEAKTKLKELETKENAKLKKKNAGAVDKKIDVKFVIKNAELIEPQDLESRAPFDAVVSSYIPKYVDAEKVVSSIEPFMQSGAKLVMHDFDVPFTPFKPVWYAHMNIMAAIGPKIWGPAWAACFESNLKELIVKSRWTEKWSETLKARGWKDVKVHRITLGGASLVTAVMP